MRSNSELISKTLTLIAPSEAADLSPLTRNKPQCLLPFGREFRVIDFTVSNWRSSGFRRAFVLPTRQAHAIATHLDSFACYFNLITVFPDPFIESKGVVDTLFSNLGLLKLEAPENVLILRTDHIYEMDYERLVQFHVERRAQATIATHGPTDIGAYVFTAAAFRRMLLVSLLAGHNHDIERSSVLRAANERDIHIVDINSQFGRYWGLVNSIDTYYHSQMDFSGPSHTGVGVASPCAEISPGADIRSSIVMSGARIGPRTRIRKAIIEEDVQIPTGTVIGMDPEEDRRRFTVSQGGVVVVSRQRNQRVQEGKDELILRLARAA